MRGLLSLVLCSACGRIDFDAQPDGTTTASCSPWGNVQSLDALESSANDWAPALSPDGLALVFDSGRGASEDLYISMRTSTTGAFGAPTPIANLNTANLQEFGASWVGTSIYYSWFDASSAMGGMLVAPYLGNGTFGAAQTAPPTPGSQISESADGLELFTTRNPAAMVYYVEHDTRASAGSTWQADTSLMYATPGSDVTGWPSYDEPRNTLYFERTVSGQPTDIVSVTRSDASSAFGPVTVVDTIGTANGDPEVSKDGTTLVFASSRTGGVGLFDLYMATRVCQ
jgi:hypothetical protein